MDQTFPDSTHAARRGLIYGLLAYGAWGVFPVYFHAMNVRGASATTIVAHRIVWAMVFLLLVITFQRQWRAVRDCFKPGRTLLLLCGSTIAIAINWFVFAYAVQSHQVLQSGLGYYINPLFNILLGAIFLQERMRPIQYLCVLLAAAGVGVWTYAIGQIQWIPLALAGSFGFYGLFRKTVSVGPLVGLTFETITLSPIAAWLAISQFRIDQQTGINTSAYGLLLSSGILTAIPLLWFAAASRRLRLSTLGFIQYVGPTLQSLVAVFYMNERFDPAKGVSFALIWIALIIYSFDSWRHIQKLKARDAIEVQSRHNAAAACD